MIGTATSQRNDSTARDAMHAAPAASDVLLVVGNDKLLTIELCGRDLVIGRGRRSDVVLRALAACAGNQTRAARQLGISRTTIVTKLRMYRIRGPRG